MLECASNETKPTNELLSKYKPFLQNGEYTVYVKDIILKEGRGDSKYLCLFLENDYGQVRLNLWDRKTSVSPLKYFIEEICSLKVNLFNDLDDLVNNKKLFLGKKMFIKVSIDENNFSRVDKFDKCENKNGGVKIKQEKKIKLENTNYNDENEENDSIPF